MEKTMTTESSTDQLSTTVSGRLHKFVMHAVCLAFKLADESRWYYKPKTILSLKAERPESDFDLLLEQAEKEGYITKGPLTGCLEFGRLTDKGRALLANA